MKFIIVAPGGGSVTELKMQLNNFVHIEIPADLKNGNILVYEEGDQAVLYDKRWNEIEKIAVHESKLTIPMGNQQLRLEFDGSANADVKVKLKVLGEKVLITGKRYKL